jgi:NitT/TauT family transport system substrate-binding protein
MRMRAKLLPLIVATLLLVACAPAAVPGGAPGAGSAAPAGGGAAPASGAAAPEATPAPERLKIIYSSLAGNYMPLWIAADAGLFREQGLDVELLLIESGTAATQALVAGESPLANRPFVTGERLAIPAGLRGGRMAVTRFGSSTDVVGRILLRGWGLEPERDVAVLQMGSVAEQLAAMETGAVDAGVLSDPTSLRASKLGYHQVVDAAELNIPYMHLGTVVPRSVLAARADLVRRYVLGYQAGLERFFADPVLAKRLLREYVKLDDAEILDASYQAYATKYFHRDVRPRPETLVSVLGAVGNPKARDVAPESLIDDRIVRQLQSEGLIPTR